MRDFLFDRAYKKKDGSIDYDRLSKARGMSKADLLFLVKADFNLLDRAYLISGVFAGYRPVIPNGLFPTRWDLRTCHNAPEDLTYITSLITNHGNNFNTLYEYFVMDCEGKILSSNIKVESSVDEQGVIKASTEDGSLDQYIYPASIKNRPYKCFYCHDENISKLNKQIQTYSDQKLIVKPRDFDGGFKIPSQQPKEQ